MLCPFAEQQLSAPGPTFTDGPFKIIWHTTEGDFIEGAISTLKHNGYESHFVIGRSKGATKVRLVQLLDTKRAAKALANKPGGIQTNRDSCIQVEVCGHAGTDPDEDTLAEMIRLARWIEKEHGIPSVWPAGPLPMSAAESMKPGRRDPNIFDNKGGHYGHSQVPENTHWDPAWSPAFVKRLMASSGAITAPGIGAGGKDFSGDLTTLGMQKFLEKKNYSPGVLDGKWGKDTKTALVAAVNDIPTNRSAGEKFIQELSDALLSELNDD